MEVDDKVEQFNPWMVESIDQFLNYCCPECDTKQKSKSEFITHAIDAHPNSRSCLPLFDYEEEKDNDEPIDHLDDTSISDFQNEEELHKLDEVYESTIGLPPKKKSKLNSPVVKLEPTDKLLEMECEDCGRFFVTKESMLDHKKEKHVKNTPRKEVKGSKKSKLVSEKKPEKQSKDIQRMSANYKGKYLIGTDPKDGIQKFKCEECGMFSKSKPGMRHHKENMHSKAGDMQKCFICPDVIPTKMIPSHMLGKHRKADGAYHCDLCSKVFKVICEPFLYHLTKEHQIGEFRHRCDQCDKVFEGSGHLKKHKKVRHEKSCVVICDKCGKECLSKTTLESHLKKVHHEYKIPKEDTIKKCDNCNIEFEKPEEFNDHLKKCLDQVKDFKCKLCDSSWVSHLSLWQHIAVDHKMLRYICDICGHASPTTKNLKEHKNHVHYKIYDFVCHICAQPKQTKKLLHEHMTLAHGQGERKFQCDKCDKSFVRSEHLKHHFESHHAKKTLYQCEQCPKTFWMKNYLNTHVRMMHENYRPHKCDICQQGFYYKRDVVSHKKHVHNIHE